MICRDHCEILSGQTRDAPSFKLHHIGYRSFGQLLNLGMAHVLQICHGDLIAASCCRTITSSDTGGHKAWRKFRFPIDFWFISHVGSAAYMRT